MADRPELCDVEIKNTPEEGQMMAMKVGDGLEVLISKYKGKVHAIGATSPHSGGSLANGVLVDDKLICANDGAAYSVTSG